LQLPFKEIISFGKEESESDENGVKIKERKEKKRE
jgi:hypothetical protein